MLNESGEKQNYKYTTIYLEIHDYFSNLINQHSNNLRLLFDTIDRILNPDINFCQFSSSKCEELVDFFRDKITNNRSVICLQQNDSECLNTPILLCDTSLEHFTLVDVETLMKVVSELKIATRPFVAIPT